MNLKNILCVWNTGHIVPNAPIADNLFGMKLSDSGIITTATGNPVSIVTNRAQNAISTILSYSPKQSGSGDPSPQNIRPIEGWTEANLFGCGKNLLDCTQPLVPNPTGSDRDGLPFYPPALGSYTIKPSKRGADNKRYAYLRGFVVHSDGTYEDYLAFSTTASDADYVPRTFEVTRKGDWIFLFAASSVSPTRNIALSEPQVELGTQATDYEPYITPTTITANLGGTYYGFSIDLERGVLRVTRVIGDLSVPNWTFREEGAFVMSSGLFTDALSNFKNGVCTCYKFNGNANSTDIETMVNRLSDKQMCVYSNANNRGRLVIKDSDIETPSALKTSLNGQYIVYPLRDPLELPLTPQTVALLAGNNTLWTDGDEVSITYKAKKA